MQSEYETKTVSLSMINLDEEAYRITTQQSIESLIPTLKSLGILHSPVLKETDASKFAIIAGRRRIATASALGWSELSAKILSPDTNDLECALIAIADNSLERTLNVVELSRAFKLLTTHTTQPDEIGHYATVLNLPYNPGYYKKIMAVSRLPQSIQEGLLNDDIALPIAIRIEKMNSKDALVFSELFKKFKYSLNKQRELIDLSTEIAIREDITTIDVLDSPDLRNIESNPDLDASQKAKKIREYLKIRRFPNLSAAENQFTKMTSALALRPGLKLSPPVNFEGRKFTLTFSFENLNDLETFPSSISELLKESIFRDYFEKR